MSVPSHPIRDALRGPDGLLEPLRLHAAVVTEVSTTTPPYQVTLRMADGAVIADAVYLAWWSPRVNDTVYLLRQGGSIVVLGPVAPADVVVVHHRHAAGDVDGTVLVTPTAPEEAPAGPSSPPNVVSKMVQPTDMATWDTDGDYWKAYMTQGGPTSKRAFWFYGNGIAAAKGAGTIVGGSIYVERLSSVHGVSGAANVRLGVHSFENRPSNGDGSLANVSVAATLDRGKGVAVRLTEAHIAALNAGADGFGLEPGATGYASADYLRALFGLTSGSGALSLNVRT